MLSTTLLLAASMVVGQAEHTMAFESFGDFMTGGKWVRIDDGKVREHVYTWELDKKFVRTDGSKDPAPWHGYFGVDLSNGKLAWWGFFADGGSGVVHLMKYQEDEWSFSGDDFFPKGKVHRKVVVTKMGANKLRAVMKDHHDGETTTIDEVWERK